MNLNKTQNLGMDPVTRREYWEILRKLKEEKKTVVMTTQFLDEAEELSDRIAVLSKGNKGLGQPFILLGKLFAEGRVDFIKRKFGTGYNLIIENIDRYLFYLLSPKKIIMMIVKQQIP